jgi:hypothetical protein
MLKSSAWCWAAYKLAGKNRLTLGKYLPVPGKLRQGPSEQRTKKPLEFSKGAVPVYSMG